MQTGRAAALVCGLMCCLLVARPKAGGADLAGAEAAKHEAAMHELLEGPDGHRQSWGAAPDLVIETSVMDYASGSLASGFKAVDKQLTAAEIAQLRTDLSAALRELTAGTLQRFGSIAVEHTKPGQVVRVLRPGQIVVGRFRGVQASTGNLGYGGRMTRGTTIVDAAVVLDETFDRDSRDRFLLRTHELGHALGLNHVESQPSVMNPHVGTAVTEFDRHAIRQAFLDAGGDRR
jgi:hypothetical protein